jgi:NAD(P)-dependent dehydrogenase (short-subunit alcohol dehydrogenase family)
MKSWITYLWQALAAMDDDALAYAAQQARAEAEQRSRRPVDLTDDDAVRAAFTEIVDREWGTRP